MKRSRALTLFYVLVFYVFFQFIWWAYLLLKLNTEIYKNSSELHQKWIMIGGEGFIFLLLLLFGIIKIRNYIEKEVKLAQQQKNFLLSITHELKSPIASVRLMLETLQKRELEKAKQRELITGALKDTDRLNSLVENILVSTQIENRVFKLEKEQVDLSAFTNNIIERFSALNNQLHLITKEIDGSVFYTVDKMAYHSIVFNLLENAAKYSPEKSTISITLKKSEKQIILSVSDHGIGIPENERKYIFEKFYRIGNEETRSSKGTGLGLYLVDYFTKAHQGQIKIDNNQARGSVFSITFNC